MEESVFCRNFEPFTLLGQGQFGKVISVLKINGNDSGTLYAMKVRKKADSDTALKRNRAFLELRILVALKRAPYVSQLFYAFQTHDDLNLIIEHLPGGTLKEHLLRNPCNNFNEIFCMAEIIVGLQQLHMRNILHRDLKTSNVMIDREGHIVLTDMGLSEIHITTDKSLYMNVRAGSTAYMAPEVVTGNQQYGFPADFWSLGVLIHFTFSRKYVYQCNSLEKLRKIIQNEEPSIDENIRGHCRGLIKGLLNKDEHARFGIKLIKTHPYFRNVNWSKVEQKSIQPPFIPMNSLRAHSKRNRDNYSMHPFNDDPLFNDFRYKDMDIQMRVIISTHSEINLNQRKGCKRPLKLKNEKGQKHCWNIKTVI